MKPRARFTVRNSPSSAAPRTTSGRGQRQEHERLGRAAAAVAVADERERHQRPERDGDDRRQRADEQRVRQRLLQADDLERVCQWSSVKPCQVKLKRPFGSLNEYSATIAIGTKR